MVRQSTICALTVKFIVSIINDIARDRGVGTRDNVGGDVKKHQ